MQLSIVGGQEVPCRVDNSPASTRQPTQDEIEQYADALRDIKGRMRIAEEYLSETATRLSVEVAALQLRCVIESICLGSLITNVSVLDRTRQQLDRLDYVGARKALRQVNPSYWPQPVDFVQDGGKVAASEVGDGFLTENDVGRWIGRTSEWLHGRSHSKPKLDPETGKTQMLDLYRQVERLLRCHFVVFAGLTWLIAADMNVPTTVPHAPGQGEIRVAVFHSNWV
jgi:hypothetical protein